MNSGYIKWAAAAVAAAVLAVVSFAVMSGTRPIGAGTIVLAAGSAQYRDLAESYRRDLESYGVRYEVRPGGEGFATLSALLDPGPGINAAFIKGGLVGSLQGRLATEKAKGRYGEYSRLQSVGRVFYEPIWVFTRRDLTIATLRDLKGKRILTGTRESGTRRIAGQLLKANGVERTNTTLVEGDLPEDAKPLIDGSADAAIVIEPPDSALMQSLLHVRNIRLMDFAGEAPAYDNRFPAITSVVLHRGAVEFDPVIPATDITLLATSAALVVRQDMDPALVSLLTHAVIGNPRSGFDGAGDPVLFYRAGDFPSANDPEFQVAPESRTIYKTGELPVLLRTLLPVGSRLGLPFSLSAFVSTYAGNALLVLIPVLALVIPFGRTVPAFYAFMMRRRILHWYQQLKVLERGLDSRGSPLDGGARDAELERIDDAVRRVQVPLNFSNELYDLRLHIDLVRQRISAAPGMDIAAE